MSRLEMPGGLVIDVEVPWCDCRQRAGGFTKRGDGVWVRPCCRRPAQMYYDRHGDTAPFTPVNEGES